MLDIRAPRKLALRYGENPHQSAALYASGGAGIAGAEQLHGKELSYNNLVDLDAAWQLIAEFDAAASAIIKHTNPCGCAEGATQAESYRRAFEADPVSAYGGVLAFNRTLDSETAVEIAKTFIEAIAAPGLHRRRAADFAAKEKSAAAKSSDGACGDCREIHQRRIPGADARCASPVARRDASRRPSAPLPMTNGRRWSSAGRSRST